VHVRLTALAERDPQDIPERIAREIPAAARRVVDGLLRKAERLSSFFRIGRTGRVAGTREFVASNWPYVPVYRLRGEQIDILRVLHTAPLAIACLSPDEPGPAR
jgi:plasmid stabilization system protein ParE